MSSSAKTRFVIFDFDGVLVDSEWIANGVEAQIKTELGFPITVEEHIRKFTGLNGSHPLVIEEYKRLPPDYEHRVDERVREVYLRELKPIDGVIETLERLQLPACVASNSDPESIRFKMSLTGLSSYFENKAFSAHSVRAGKPEPDLYLYALKQMNWKADDVLVIEDSEAGVRAARAAGLRVVGFLGGRHIQDGHAEKLLRLGAMATMARMTDLFRFL